MSAYMSACLSFNFSCQPSIRSTLHLARIWLRTQARAVSSVTFFLPERFPRPSTGPIPNMHDLNGHCTRHFKYEPVRIEFRQFPLTTSQVNGRRVGRTARKCFLKFFKFSSLVETSAYLMHKEHSKSVASMSSLGTGHHETTSELSSDFKRLHDNPSPPALPSSSQCFRLASCLRLRVDEP